MNIILSSRLSKDKIKTFWSLEWGKNAGQRKSTGIFTYTHPKDLVEKNYNKEALEILKTKQSELTLERNSIGSKHVPVHKFKTNFLDYYSDFVRRNRKFGNRHLENSLPPLLVVFCFSSLYCKYKL